MERSLTVLSSLRRLGWQKSIRRGPVDAAGDPIPWITYPAIDWIDRIRPTLPGNTTVIHEADADAKPSTPQPFLGYRARSGWDPAPNTVFRRIHPEASDPREQL
jgi:hypothetical protein